MSAAIVTVLLSALLCGLYLRFARSRQIVDTPNERSSHTLPTPHGGGIALLLAFALGLWLTARWYGGWDESFVQLAVAAIFLMMVGVIDDLRSLSVTLRLALYGGVCLFVAAGLLQDLPEQTQFYRWVLILFAALAMLWSLNLFNFMDGIDGLAAIQTVLACGCAATLSWGSGRDADYAQFCLLLAAAHCGFLIWNWPPAKLFMGDSGSVPSGFLLAALVVLGAVQGQLNPACWLVLLAVFFTDASWTLAWRLMIGQVVTQPHRQHAYQRLSRHWGSHLKVDLLLMAISAIWLFPIAWGAREWPHYSLFLVILAYLPLIWGMAKVGRLE